MYSNKLIFGKNDLTNVVSVEPDGENLIIFQEKDNEVITQSIPATYWFITNKRISKKQIELEGNQYYKYLAEFSSLEEFEQVRPLLYQKRIDFYSIWDKKECNMVRQGITYYKGMQPKDVSVLSFDIESDGLNKTQNSEVYIITNTFRQKDEIIRQSFFLEDYESQAAMLEDWCNFVRIMNPSIILGHNIFSYDFPYLAHVAKLNDISLKLGRDDSDIRFNEKASSFRKDGSQSYEYNKAFIYGRELVDTMFLSIKYDVSRNFTSYGLKSIIKQLGLEKDDRSFVDASKIKYYYNNRKINPEIWDKTKSYAEEDSDDALKLYDLMSSSFFYFTQNISKTYQEINCGATGSQINNMMVRSYLQIDHSIAKASEAEGFEGAISFGVPGIYRNTFKQDVSSLYPSIMRQYKVYDKYKDPKKYFLELVETFTLERLKNKKLAKETGNRYYTDLEQSQKIAINSMYGFMGAQGLNYNSPYNAALVTRKGREILEKAVIFATGYNVNYWKEKAGIEIEVENE